MGFFKSEYIRNITKVSIGVLIAQILSVFLSPIITRLYAPSEFGLFSLYISIVLIIEVCACLRYEMTIVLAEDDSKASSIMSLCAFIMIAIAFIVGILLVILYYISSIDCLPFKWNNLYWLMPVSIIAVSSVNLLSLWCTRKKYFSIIALIQAGIVIVNNALSILAGVVWGGEGQYLVYSQLLSYVFIIIISSILLIKKDASVISYPDIKKFIRLLREYKRMALYNTPASVINVFSQRLPAYTFPQIYGMTSVGYYDLVYRILKLPSQIIGNSIRNVFFQRASDDYNRTGSFATTLVTNVKALISLAVFPFSIVGAFAPFVFPLIFGTEWVEAGWYVIALIPWLMTSFIVVPMSSAVSITSQDNTFFKLQLWCLLARFAIILIGAKLSTSPIFTITGFSLIGCLFQLLMLDVIGKSTGVKLRVYFDFKTIVYIVLSIVASALIYLMVKEGLIIIAIIVTLFFGSCYGLYIKHNLITR